MATSRLHPYSAVSVSARPAPLPGRLHWAGLWASLRARLRRTRPEDDPWLQGAGPLMNMDDHQLADIGAPAWLRAAAGERRARPAQALLHWHRLHL